jgi:hypothetical protein
VLERIEEDGEPDDVQWFVAGPTTAHVGAVIIDHLADDRRWYVFPHGFVTWGPVPLAVLYGVTA